MNVKVKLSCMNSCRLAVREFARIHASHLNAKGKIVKISTSMMRVDENCNSRSRFTHRLSLTLNCMTQILMRVFATHAVISFDQGMRVEKTLMQTLASQLS